MVQFSSKCRKKRPVKKGFRRSPDTSRQADVFDKALWLGIEAAPAMDRRPHFATHFPKI
jgi:hypothetical protein